jgi:hypothetical protein
MRQGTSGFINVFQVYPNMFRQVFALEATQAAYVLWAYTDYYPSNCGQLSWNLHSTTDRTGRIGIRIRLQTPTIQTLPE